MDGVLHVPLSEHRWGSGRSSAVPLIWDVFAVSTYGTVSALVLVCGIDSGPGDAAGPRDEQSGAESFTACWRWAGAVRRGTGTGISQAYLLLAGLATPLVLSVHTVVSFDFAIAIVPGWHTTIFPPYFVAGAIYSGFAMVLTIAIPLRKAYDLEDFITMRHLENMAKVMLATGLIVAYGYFFEFFMSLYSGNKFDVFLVNQRLHGPYAPYYYALILCNHPDAASVVDPEGENNCVALFVMSLVINLGMWLERFVIVVISLTRDFVPALGDAIERRSGTTAHSQAPSACSSRRSFCCARLPAISIAEMPNLVAHTSRSIMKSSSLPPRCTD
jgi:molybdopterin-containing oxidoreductase family membrane subunit